MVIPFSICSEAGAGQGLYASAAQRAGGALLFVRQAQRRPALRRPAERREQQSEQSDFETAALKIESTARYRRSLQKLLELEQRFGRTLTVAQRSIWLELEEALLEHASQLYRSYFESGVAIAAGRSREGHHSRQKLRRRDFEIAEALARVLARLTTRAGG